ncbi:hypothetical protein [Pseudonocardia spinosispora]|uniref:hypothetical protein n=1 Tax=Pseudonocardia spinosispora TaxID=103441 RepID=UPI0012EC0D47|nr:hypothetical protein [Pseudonocardia spinosispora]
MTLYLVPCSGAEQALPSGGVLLPAVGSDVAQVEPVLGGSVEDITGGRGSRGALSAAYPVRLLGEGLGRHDIRDIFALLRRVEPAMARRSAVSISSRGLAQLERNADLIAFGELGPSEINQLYTVIRGGLLMPGASYPEVGAIIPLLRLVSAHFGVHYRRLGTHPHELGDCDDTNERLIAGFRDGDPARASAAVEEHLDGCERYALDLLDLD